MTEKKETDSQVQIENQPMKKNDCECGHQDHYEEANYCVNCGAKLR
jgi:hypothetical protein